MNETKQLELAWLKQLYIEDLSKIIQHWTGEKRSRVRHPGNWERLEPQHRLNESHEQYLELPCEGKNVWLWSDLHFFHTNIIDFSERPFRDIYEMNEYLVANYNEYVGPNDISIWVGDVGFSNDEAINNLLDRCQGYKILVVGNHDFNKKKIRNLNFDEVHLLYTIDTQDVSLLLTHYPMDNVPWPWVNVHGHLHLYPNPDTGHPLHYNINCEVHNYRPVHLDDVVKAAKLKLGNYKGPKWESD